MFHESRSVYSRNCFPSGFGFGEPGAMDGEPSFLGFADPLRSNEIIIKSVQHCSRSSFRDRLFVGLSDRCYESFPGFSTSGSRAPAQVRSIGSGYSERYATMRYGGERRQNQSGASKLDSLLDSSSGFAIFELTWWTLWCRLDSRDCRAIVYMTIMVCCRTQRCAGRHLLNSF